MEEKTQEMEALISELEAKEKKRRRNALFYLGLPLLAGLVLTFWTIKQGETIYLKAQEIQSQRHQIKQQTDTLDSIRTQLQDTRAASEYIRIGINNFHAKNYAAAVTAYDRAIELDPMNPMVFDLRGYSLLRKGESEKAVESLKRSVEIDPTYIWGHYDLALAYWAVGDRSNAIAEVKKVLELDPGFRDIIRNDGQFNKFRVSEQYRRLIRQQ